MGKIIEEVDIKSTNGGESRGVGSDGFVCFFRVLLCALTEFRPVRKQALYSNTAQRGLSLFSVSSHSFYVDSDDCEK